MPAVPSFELGESMKCIDYERAYLVGAKPTRKGEPFELSASDFDRMSKQYPSLQKFGQAKQPEEPQPEPQKVLGEEPKAEPEAEPKKDEPKVPEGNEPEPDEQPTEVKVATYKGGGWYDLDGESVRLADVPKGVKIVRE